MRLQTAAVRGRSIRPLPAFVTSSALFACLASGAFATGREVMFDEPDSTDEFLLVPPSTGEYAPSVPDPRVGRVPDLIARGLSVEPDSWVGPLVDTLLAGLAGDSARLRVIHDWVTLNIGYDTALLSSAAPGETDAAAALRRGCSGCAGYSNVFELLCRSAGIECVTVTGYARGFGFDFFASEDPTVPNHAWNAVRIDGSWQLVDATWDAGHVRGGHYEPRYATDFLLAPPGAFIYTHLPCETTWQLLERPVSPGEFTRLPYLPGEFFRFGLRLVEPLSRVTEAGRTARVEVWVSDDISLFARIICPDGRRLHSGVTGRRQLEKVVFDIELPGPGRWSVGLFARPAPAAGEHTCVALFEFVWRGGPTGPGG